MKKLFLIACVVFVSCHTKGKVTYKQVEPAHYETTYIKIGETLCPQTKYIPEKYRVILDDKQITGSFYVDKQTFDALSVGQQTELK